jgi:hypothetical protein
MFELLSYYARRWCKYEGAAVDLIGSLLDYRPIIENEPLRVMKKSGKTRAIIRLAKVLAKLLSR